MKVNVLLFATLRDIAGTRQLDLTLKDDSATLDDVRRALISRFPQLQDNLQASNAAINEEFAFGADVVKDGDEVAFFPPVSGGASHPEYVSLVQEEVDHNALIKAITTPETGAVVVFSGIVRGETKKDGHMPQTSHLIYEAYESMALAKMRQVIAEIREQYPGVIGVAIVQRVGKANAGENTVLIACSAAHRDGGCYEACRYGIDRLKEIVPVWKQEVGPDGTTWIEGDYTVKPDDRTS